MRTKKFSELRAKMSPASQRRAKARTNRMAAAIVASRDRALLSFSLGELQLLALGLWVIGDDNRVDWKLMPDYAQLRADVQRGLQRQADLASQP